MEDYTVKEFFDILKDFIEKHPECKDLPILCRYYNNYGKLETVRCDTPELGKDEFDDICVLV